MKARRIFSIVIALAMVLAPLTVNAASFTDTQSHWGEKAIARWSDFGVVKGNPNGTFDPDSFMTRGQGCQIFTNLFRLTSTKGAKSFKDVLPTDWFADAVAKASAKGIVNGTSETEMSPEQPISREEFFVMYARGLGLSPQKTTKGPKADGNSWSEGYINALTDRGFVVGDSNGVNALAEINRASVMSLLDQSIDVYAAEPGSKVTAGAGDNVLVVADNVTISGEADMVVVASENGAVTLNNATVDELNIVTDANVSLTGTTNVDSVAVSEGGDDASIAVSAGSTVGEVDVAAEDVSITGSGKVTTVNETDDAVGTTTVSTPNTTVNATTVETTVAADGTTTTTTTVETTTNNASGKAGATTTTTTTETTAADGTTNTTTETKTTPAPTPASSGGSSGGSSHSHTYSNDWTSDETNHWHAATCGHAVKSGEAAHSFEDGVCTVCGYAQYDVLITKAATSPSSITFGAFVLDVNSGNDYNGFTVTLQKDINVSGAAWTPIGTEAAPFRGTIDGNNKTISGMSGTNGGFIGYAGNGMTIKDLTLVDVNISNAGNVGGFINTTKKTWDGADTTPEITLTNCNISGGSITCTDGKLGGLIGECYGANYSGNLYYPLNVNISDCDVSLTTLESAQYRVGGLFGYMSNCKGDISDCTVIANPASTVGSKKWVGGFAGGIGALVSVNVSSFSFTGTATSTLLKTTKNSEYEGYYYIEYNSMVNVSLSNGQSLIGCIDDLYFSDRGMGYKAGYNDTGIMATSGGITITLNNNNTDYYTVNGDSVSFKLNGLTSELYLIWNGVADNHGHGTNGDVYYEQGDGTSETQKIGIGGQLKLNPSSEGNENVYPCFETENYDPLLNMDANPDLLIKLVFDSQN